MLKWLRSVLMCLLSLPKAITMSLMAPIFMMLANQAVAKRGLREEPFCELSDQALDDLISSEWQRARDIDDNLYKLTAALSVSLAVAGLAGTTLLQALSHSDMKFSIAIIFIVSSLQLIVGVYIGFSGAIPKPRYGYGALYLRITSSDSEAARKERILAASAFERDNLIRSNEATAATISIRNGVLILALALLASLLVAMFDLPRDSDHQDYEIFLVFDLSNRSASPMET